MWAALQQRPGPSGSPMGTKYCRLKCQGRVLMWHGISYLQSWLVILHSVPRRPHRGGHTSAGGGNFLNNQNPTGKQFKVSKESPQNRWYSHNYKFTERGPAQKRTIPPGHPRFTAIRTSHTIWWGSTRRQSRRKDSWRREGTWSKKELRICNKEGNGSKYNSRLIFSQTPKVSLQNDYSSIKTIHWACSWSSGTIQCNDSFTDKQINIIH